MRPYQAPTWQSSVTALCRTVRYESSTIALVLLVAIRPPCSVLVTDLCWYLDRASLATTSAQTRLYHQRETVIYSVLSMMEKFSLW